MNIWSSVPEIRSSFFFLLCCFFFLFRIPRELICANRSINPGQIRKAGTYTHPTQTRRQTRMPAIEEHAAKRRMKQWEEKCRVTDASLIFVLPLRLFSRGSSQFLGRSSGVPSQMHALSARRAQHYIMHLFPSRKALFGWLASHVPHQNHKKSPPLIYCIFFNRSLICWPCVCIYCHRSKPNGHYYFIDWSRSRAHTHAHAHRTR